MIAFLAYSYLQISTWGNYEKDPIELQNDFAQLMNERYRHVKDTCAQTNLVSKRSFLQSSHIYWMQKQNIAYCPSFKSATSTWLNNLVQISNHSQPEIERVKQKHPFAPIDQLRNLGAINPSRSKWSDYITSLNYSHNLTGFMVVRHPFDRMVSAFRDKLERNKTWYHHHYGEHFVKRYRQQAIKVLGNDFFNETNNFGTLIDVKDNQRPSSEFASFWEFAQSVIDRYKIDEHWAPIYEYCSICDPLNIKAFRYFLKFENLNDEEDLFIRKFHWDTQILITEKLNQNRPHKISGNDLTHLYFSILSNQQIFKLYQFYERDFILFNYTFTINNLRFPPLNFSINIDHH